jgi:hypothetical protein
MKKVGSAAAQEIEKCLTLPICWQGGFSTGTRSSIFQRWETASRIFEAIIEGYKSFRNFSAAVR